jgi:hypothetical protein
MRPQPERNNHRLFSHSRTFSLLAYKTIQDCLRERDIEGTDVEEWDIRDTVATY